MLMRLQHKRPDGEVDTYHLKPGRKYHLGRGSSCELRILDLKLSRKHCCIEFLNGTWQIEDLGSTNGCKVDGQQIVGTQNLVAEQTIEAGTTSLVVAGFSEPGDDSAARLAAVQQEALPDSSERPLSEGAVSAGDWDPEPVSDHLAKTGPLQPAAGAKKTSPALLLKTPAAPGQSEGDGSITLAPNTLFASASALTPRDQPPAVRPPPPPPTALAAAVASSMPQTAETRPAPKIKPVTIRVGRIDGETMHTPTATPILSEQPPAPDQPPAAGDERTFYITVLGRRIGPLSRLAARELKARELKGLLTLGELDSYPKA